ncbi:MAG: hypothetical protein M3460_01920 [Actinomycetota bacterium]|nr:hypothetical protein [Actinomycetota bacterium]
MNFELRLPKHKTLLALTDPIWYAGRKVPCEVLDAIKARQLNTGSLVFVDGTFRYMQWDGTPVEVSAQETLRQRPATFCSLGQRRHGRAFLVCDKTSFELSGYPDHVRINLLNNSAIDVL